jgi:hypothetical protein
VLKLACPKNTYLFSFCQLGQGHHNSICQLLWALFYLTHPVNFPCGRKPEYPGKTHDFRQSVDFLLFSHEDWVRVASRKYLVRFEPAASEVKGKCANHLATEAPRLPELWLEFAYSEACPIHFPV